MAIYKTMKHIITALLLFLLTTVTALAAPRDRVATAPAFLRPGDKVAIVSPASWVSAANIQAAATVIEQWGYTPVVGRNSGAGWHGFAGTLEQRQHDFITALQDTSVKAIFCTQGGYGSVQLLCELPVTELRNNPKWIIGFSDVTALHSAWVSAGIMSVHANMAARLRVAHGQDTTMRALRGLLQGRMPSYTVPSHSRNVTGKAHGVIVGGNLTVMNSLAGSQYDMLSPAFMAQHDVILFIEDVHERIYHVDRLLHSLKLRGILPRLKGLIVGSFTDYRKNDDWATMTDMLSHYLKDYTFPIAYGFPVGHVGSENFPIIEGCAATLVVGPESTTLTFDSPHPAPPRQAR